MNFREFYKLQEVVGNYMALRHKDGSISVHADDEDTPTVLFREKPIKVWKFTIRPGDTKMNIPGATNQEKEDIGVAYYDLWKLHRPSPEEGPGAHYDPYPELSDVIDSPIFDPQWKKKVANKSILMPPQSATID